MVRTQSRHPSAPAGHIAAYLAGGVLGLLTFTRLLKYLLKHYSDLIVAILTGLMLGSSKLLFDRATESTPAGLMFAISIICGIVVVALFHSVQMMKKRMNH
ncbi:MAG TPA: DUF368 domain-containing protein [Methanospirillum sp.]|nr:DUF368 domain-containing protein [Methanospirillum sp.]